MGQRFASCMLILAAAVLWPSGAHGQSSDLAGTWEGNIRGPGTMQAVSVTIRIDGEGAFTGTADIPSQDAQIRPLINIEVRDQYVSFQVAGIPGNPLFDGAVSVDGRTYFGNFSQGGETFSFSLAKRTETMERSSNDTAAVAGLWDGTLDAGALKLRFLLTVSESAGDVAMTMGTGEQGVRELDVTLTIQGDEVRLNVPALGAVYVGTLDEGGETISGTWRQADARLPLTFEKTN